MLHIRWMIRRDLDAVLAIEQAAFEYPWDENDFIGFLRQRNCIGLVLEQVTPAGLPIGRQPPILGFTVYALHKTQVHVLNLATAPAFQRGGVGATLVDKLKAKLGTGRRNRLVLEVRETNLAAQLFFHAQGFRAISVVRDFYDDTPEDAYTMEYCLPAAWSRPVLATGTARRK